MPVKQKSRWQNVPIKDVYLGLFDGPHATPKPASEGPIFLGIKNITEDGRLNFTEVRHISEEDYPKWTKRVEPQPGDIVFTYEATLNRYAIIPERFRGCLGRRLALIRPNPEIVDTRYLFYYFFGNEWRATINQNILSGSTVDRVPLSSFPNFEISLPPMTVQRGIASILSAYDDLIKNNTRRLKILEEMAQSLYREWFINFHFPGHEKAKFIDSPLGKIPKGWNMEKLGDACTIIMGQSPKSEFYNEMGEGLHFHQGVKDFGSRFPTDRLYCTVTNRVAEKGDLLFSVRAPVGRINLANKKIIIGRGLSAIRSKKGWQAFVFQQLKERFREEDIMGGGTIFRSVTKTDMHNIDLLVSTSSLIVKFESTIRPIFAEIKNLFAINDNLRDTRELLLPKLVAGSFES